MKIDRIGADSQTVLVLLTGVSGPNSFYRAQAEYFAKHGFLVLLPHYLETGHGSTPTDENYDIWINAIRTLVDKTAEGANGDPSRVVMVGYSLGASIALGLASKDRGPDAIVDFYGSLPDRYYRDLVHLPPLLILHGGLDDVIPVTNAQQLSQLCSDVGQTCKIHIYPLERHGFTADALQDADERVLRFLQK